MKVTLTFFAFLLLSSFLLAQVPQSMNYQAIARESNGTPITTGSLSTVQFEILEGSAMGNQIFTETHSNVLLNPTGLFNLKIGSINQAQFSAINWSTGAKYLKVTINGNITSNATEMLSVPYALYAASGVGNTYVAGQGINITGNVISSTGSGGGSIGMRFQQLALLNNGNNASNDTELNSAFSVTDGSRFYTIHYSGSANPGTLISIYKRDLITGQYYVYHQKQGGSGFSKPTLIGSNVYFITSNAIIRVDTADFSNGAALNPTTMSLVGSSFNGTSNLATDNGTDLLIYNQNSSSWVRHTIAGSTLTNAGICSGPGSNAKNLYDGAKMYAYSGDGTISKFSNCSSEAGFQRKICDINDLCFIINGGMDFLYVLYQMPDTRFISLVPIPKNP